MRPDGRAPLDLRPVTLELDCLRHPEGSALIRVGDTRVLCTASVEERVPPFLKGSGGGWVTAEYAMLPRATETRNARETGRGGVSGRSQEIQRLIGRCLRAVVDTRRLGERTVIVDCDVLQADGGTRTAAVTGGYVALALAVDRLLGRGVLPHSPLLDTLAAVSVGVVDGQVRLDLCYAEDSRAEVDLNLAGTGDGRLVEIQGTAEGQPFPRGQLDEMLGAGGRGLAALAAAQRNALAGRVDWAALLPKRG